MDEQGPGFEMLAASLRADARDLATFLEVLAAKLSEALPGDVGVEREGGLFSKKRVKKLTVQIGEHRYDLGRAGSGLEARHSHAVRGINLKSEAMGVEEWIEALSTHLAQHAKSSEHARVALDRLLQG